MDNRTKVCSGVICFLQNENCWKCLLHCLYKNLSHSSKSRKSNSISTIFICCNVLISMYLEKNMYNFRNHIIWDWCLHMALCRRLLCDKPSIYLNKENCLWIFSQWHPYLNLDIINEMGMSKSSQYFRSKFTDSSTKTPQAKRGFYSNRMVMVLITHPLVIRHR